MNTYQVLLFVAASFHSFVNKLPPSRRVVANPHFFFGEFGLPAVFVSVKEFIRALSDMIMRLFERCVCKCERVY